MFEYLTNLFEKNKNNKIYQYYFDCIISLLIMLIAIICVQSISHIKRQFFEKDINLSYYNTEKDEVTVIMLYLISFVISYVICGILSFINYIDWKKSKYSHITKIQLMFIQLFALTYAIASSALATEIIKKVVSNPRPEFYYLCNYNGYADAVNSGNYTLYNSISEQYKIGDYENCYNKNGLSDAISSFPSGHTSTAFSSLLFTVFVIQNMLELKNIFTIGGMFSYGPLIISTWIAISRVKDTKHHEYDIIGGAIIGSVCAILAYNNMSECINKIFEQFENEKSFDHVLTIVNDNQTMTNNKKFTKIRNETEDHYNKL